MAWGPIPRVKTPKRDGTSVQRALGLALGKKTFFYSAITITCEMFLVALSGLVVRWQGSRSNCRELLAPFVSHEGQ